MLEGIIPMRLPYEAVDDIPTSLDAAKRVFCSGQRRSGGGGVPLSTRGIRGFVSV